MTDQITDKPRCHIEMKRFPLRKVRVDATGDDGTFMFSFTTRGLDLAQVHDKALGYVPAGYIPVFKMPQSPS